MSDSVPRAERRYEEGRTRRTRWLVVVALICLVALIAVWLYVQPNSGGDVTSAARATQPSVQPLPKSCVDALALADILATHVGPLAQAANDHVNVMELLQLTIDGKPGGIDGKEAFRRSEPQMMIMAEHGPDAEVQTKRYKKVRKACPLQ
jgi:hypothetical protein